MDKNDEEDFLPVPEDENEHSMLDDFESSNGEQDDDMDEFDTTLPDEPDTDVPKDVGDVVGGEEDGDAY